MRCPTRSTLFPYTTLFRSIVGDAFGKNADGAVLFEDFEAGLERLLHRTHRPRVVLKAVDRNDAALLQQPGERFEAKQLHGSDEVDLTWDQRADDKRVGD